MADSVYFGADDEQMKQAVKYARKTFKFFLRETSWERRRIIPGLDLAAVKLSFKTDKKPLFGKANVPETEHMWAIEPVFDGKNIAGTLINKPKWVKGLKAGKPTGGPIDMFSDWMYVVGGRVYGGFTVDAMRRAMDPQEREQHDAAWGLDFGTPGQVLLAPELTKDEDGEATYAYENTNAGFTIDRRGELAKTSHPMDLNMRESLEQTIQKQPEFAHQVDEIGMTILHDEAMCGNDQTVAVLLKHGADKSARNQHGQTPLDLAKLMGWPRVMALLEG